jgi:urea carboxylase
MNCCASVGISPRAFRPEHRTQSVEPGRLPGVSGREAETIAAFRSQQQGAFNAERERWIASGQAHFDSEELVAQTTEDAPLASGQHSVDSHIAGNLWQVQVDTGTRVEAGDVLVILESMKMEIPLLAPMAGVVREIRVQPGSAVRAGQRVVVLELD